MRPRDGRTQLYYAHFSSSARPQIVVPAATSARGLGVTGKVREPQTAWLLRTKAAGTPHGLGDGDMSFRTYWLAGLRGFGLLLVRRRCRTVHCASTYYCPTREQRSPCPSQVSSRKLGPGHGAGIPGSPRSRRPRDKHLTPAWHSFVFSRYHTASAALLNSPVGRKARASSPPGPSPASRSPCGLSPNCWGRPLAAASVGATGRLSALESLRDGRLGRGARALRLVTGPPCPRARSCSRSFRPSSANAGRGC